MSAVGVRIRRLPHGLDLPLPAYATAASAGADLHAAAELVLGPSERAAVPTGIAIALPDGFEAQVRPRSGLALTHGVTVVNSPGTIDADYRGEIKVILVNLGGEDFAVRRGMRIAQLVVAPISRLGWIEVETLDETERGDAGFGSTGTARARGG